MILPELRNVPYPGDTTDQDLCALFSTERGERVLESWTNRGAALDFLVAEIRTAIARVHRHCGTGKLTPQ